ncbi:MAG: VCBS repeat-containing protein [Planctomycetota bacterium]
MRARWLWGTFTVVALGVALSAPRSVAEDAESIRFAPPQRIQAGSFIAGAGRNFPSPVMHDVDGDKRADIVIGDLDGRVTYARRNKDGSFAAEQPLRKRDGKPLKFHNW